jgi:hypothetical protein
MMMVHGLFLKYNLEAYHGTNPSVWDESFILGYIVGFDEYFFSDVMALWL